MNNVNVEEKLSVNKYYIDEDNPHIILKQDIPTDEYHKLVLACPAALYKLDQQGRIRFDFAGCLECGTCRVLCGSTALEKWEYPAGTFGIEFRYG